MVYYYYKFKEGTTLLIELKNHEIYEAQFESGNPDFIIVYNFSLLPSEQKNESSIKFAKYAITSINIEENEVSSKEDEVILTPEDDKEGAAAELPTVTKYQEQYEKLQQIAYDHIYISEIDENYYNAIGCLQLLGCISVYGEGSQNGRQCSVNLLAIGTNLDVYIFDIKMIGCLAFDMGLKEILEDELIQKVVYNGRMFDDCMQHAHNVSINGIFDVELVDFNLRLRDKDKSIALKKMRKLSEILQDYMNLPAKIYEQNQVNCKQLIVRPLLHDVKYKTAIKAACLNVITMAMEDKLDSYNCVNGNFFF